VQIGELKGQRYLAQQNLQQEYARLGSRANVPFSKRFREMNQQFDAQEKSLNLMMTSFERGMTGAVSSLEYFFKKFDFGSIGFSTGGLVGKGGKRKGSGDTENIWADPREFIIRPEAVAKYGTNFLNALNSQKFKTSVKEQKQFAIPYNNAKGNEKVGDVVNININHPDANEIVRRVDEQLTNRAKSNKSRFFNLIQMGHGYG